MRATAVGSGAVRTFGVLSLIGFLRRTWPARLPNYSSVHEALLLVADRAWVATLWRGIFHEPAPDIVYVDLQVWMAQRIHQELFPLDLDLMDELLTNDENGNMFFGPIPIESHGVPWEATGLEDNGPAMTPVIAALIELLTAFDEAHYDSLVGWYERYGYDRPQYADVRSDSEADLDRLRRALSLLPAPLDGLEVAVDVVVKHTENTFLDQVPVEMWYEYGTDWDADNWGVEEVRKLAREWAAARPRIARLDAYAAWFEATADAQDQVIQILTRALDGRYRIVDDEVIWGE